MAQQIFAKIKKSSSYYHQNEWHKMRGDFPFEVEIIGDPSGWCVKGGVGGQYRLKDVNLFIKSGTHEIRIR